MTWAKEYNDCLEYIDNYWEKIIYKPSRMRLRYKINNIPFLLTNRELPQLRMGVKKNDIKADFVDIPHYYFVPNDNKFKYIFYWDSFFMFKGLMGTNREWLMKEQVENFIYLFNTYQIIPNFNTPASMGRSQPPFFSSMILDTYTKRLNPTNPYKHVTGVRAKLYSLSKKAWLREAIKVAKKEYEIVWIDKVKAYNHSVKGFGLSRYGDRDIGYAHSSELESGWDMTSRFYNRCDQFLPIDLNSYLYKYEKDFATVAQLLGDREETEEWENKAKERAAEINKYMWDDDEGFFFDYGYVFKQVGHFFSLASYTPMWAGYATEYQAKRMVDKLSKFETPYGLTNTAQESLARPIDLSMIQRRYHPAIEEILKPKQWDYPSIFSPTEYLTVIGLLKYGYIEEAKRIMSNSVKTHAKLFRKYGTFFEKLNGETGQQSVGFHYAMQEGFGWTNTTFYRYIQILDALETSESIYKEPKASTPPYELAILH